MGVGCSKSGSDVSNAGSVANNEETMAATVAYENTESAYEDDITTSEEDIGSTQDDISNGDYNTWAEKLYPERDEESLRRQFSHYLSEDDLEKEISMYPAYLDQQRKELIDYAEAMENDGNSRTDVMAFLDKVITEFPTLDNRQEELFWNKYDELKNNISEDSIYSLYLAAYYVSLGREEEKLSVILGINSDKAIARFGGQWSDVTEVCYETSLGTPNKENIIDGVFPDGACLGKITASDILELATQGEIKKICHVLEDTADRPALAFVSGTGIEHMPIEKCAMCYMKYYSYDVSLEDDSVIAVVPLIPD